MTFDLAVDCFYSQYLVGHTDERASPTERDLIDLYETELEPYSTPIGSKVTMTSAIQLVNGYATHLFT